MCAVAQEHRLNFEFGPEGRASPGLQVSSVTWDCLTNALAMPF